MEIDYNMLIQNHVHYNMLSKKSPYGVVVQWLMIWFLNLEVRSSSLHTCNLAYFGCLSDLIK
jgi:hypothetical protein